MDDANQVTVVEEKPAEVATQGEAGSILSVIERAALNPNVDIDKLERLYAMRERALDREAEMAFNDAMRNAQSEIKGVVRKLENKQTNSKYADIAAVNNAVMPVATSHGFSISFGTADCPIERHMRITAMVSHSGGHSRNYQADIPADGEGLKGNANKTATHAFGSTMTYGRRYLLLLIFNISTADDDGNGAGGSDQIVTQDDIQELKETGEARAESGMVALQHWWKKDLTNAERNAMMHDLERLKTLAKDSENAATQ